MSKFKEVLAQVGVYTSAFALTQFVSVIGAVIVRHFLGPVQTGVWSLVQVILTYTDYANLGATYAIPIELPAKMAQGKTREAESMKNVMFSFSLLTSTLFSFGVLCYAMIRRSQISEELFYGLLISAGLVILQQMNNILISLLRAYKNFKLAGTQMFLSSIINIILVAILSFKFKLYGFMFAMCLSFIFNIAFIIYFESFRIRLELSLQVLKGLIQYGFPLMILGFVGTVLLTIDKIMIARFLGLEALGLYSIAVMTSGFICSIPNSIGVVLLPNVSEKYAQGESVYNLKSYVKKSNHVFSIVMPLIIGFSWFLVPLVVSFLIPKFTQGVIALKYLALSTFFVGLTQAYSNFIVVSKKHFWQFPITVCVCFVAVTSMLFAIKQGAGINEVALIMTGLLMLNYLALHLFAGSHIFNRSELVKEFFGVFIHFVFMLVVLFSLDRILTFLPFLLRSICQCLFLLILYAPFLFKLNKAYGVWSIFQEKIFRSRQASA